MCWLGHHKRGFLRGVKGGGADRQAAVTGAGCVSVDGKWPRGQLVIDPREASAAMALMTAATEANTHITGFSGGMVPLTLSPSMRLNGAVRAVSGLPFDRTDCARPMLYALDRGLSVDAFVVYTDSETWAGSIYPVQAPRQYRERTVEEALICSYSKA